MKKVILLASLLLIGITAYGQSDQQGFSASAWGGFVLGDDAFSEFYGFSYGGNLHYTITDSESIDFGLSAGLFHLTPTSDYSDFIDGETFWRIFGHVIFEDVFTEGQNLSAGLGYSSALDGDADYNGIYAEVFYHFDLSDRWTLAPGAFYVAGSDDAGDILVGALRTTFKF